MVSPILLERWATRDVERVRRHARIVVELRGDDTVHVYKNTAPLLEVVAVVGPRIQGTLATSDAVLCEVGLQRTRPYQRTERRDKQGRAYLSLLPARRHDISLSPTQYQKVAPVLLSLLVERMREVVGQWKEEMYWFRTQRLFANRKNVLVNGEKLQSYPRGCRISVNRADVFLCADLLRAEYEDPFWSEQMVGLATTIKFAFHQFEQGYRLPFAALPEVRSIREYLDHRVGTSLPSYVLDGLVQYLNQQRGEWPKEFRSTAPYRLSQEVSELVTQVTGVDAGHPAWQCKMMAYTLPGFSERVGGLSVRDISSLRPADRNKGYLVFELLPQPRSKER